MATICSSSIQCTFSDTIKEACTASPVVVAIDPCAKLSTGGNMRSALSLPSQLGLRALNLGSSATLAGRSKALSHTWQACSPRTAKPFSSNGVRSMTSASQSTNQEAGGQGGSERDVPVTKGGSPAPQAQQGGAGQGGGGQLARPGGAGSALMSPFRSAFADLWDPFVPGRSLRQMIDSVDRMFDSLMPSTFFQSDWPTVRTPALRLPWDVRETDDAFEMHVDMPGVPKENVKVAVEDGDTLVIRSEKKTDDMGDDWQRRRYANYQTRVLLPDNVNVDDIHAELKHGVLELKIPKIPEDTQQANVKEVQVK